MWGYMDDNVVEFNGYTKLPIDLQRMVKNIDWESKQDALILTINKDGEFIPYSNNPDEEKAIWLATKFINNIMNGVYS